jgi:cysteine synthase
MSAGYAAVMARREEILLRATGIDYAGLTRGRVAFDAEGLMARVGLGLEEIREIQLRSGVGDTPLLELRNLTELVRRRSAPGKGARILIKDEAANPSGSFKDRRASLSAHHAREAGYAGLIAATSGNYGAAVAAQAAVHGLRAIIIQEAFDSAGRGQPEILEKGRKCEALGAEVLQTTVGPELFYVLLRTLEETGYFNASLYTPFSVAGIETLGVEIAEQTRTLTGRDPDLVLATHAGGGMVTGTARGLRAAGAEATRVVGVSVNLRGLHMASDRDFNRKSFTTGHTGFSIPFTTWPDRVDVPRNAARPLRHLDRFVLVTQGEVFYTTELLARLEGLERGPAGNTSLAAALVLASELDREQTIVVSETEYTGAGKSPVAQLAFAARMGVEVRTGERDEDDPGRVISIPTRPEQLRVEEVDLQALRASYLRHALAELGGDPGPEAGFLAQDSGAGPEAVRQAHAG